MTQVLRSLEEISTTYRIFEKDQVLTHDQLNSIARYFDDQTRLTRVKLLGVGIVCGLRASVQASKVMVTKGVGVSTDGDLLYFNQDAVFDRFKPYDESHPVYSPFYTQGQMIKVHELVREGVADPGAVSLSQFSGQTGTDLAGMVAVLLMESYVKDEDICTATDCDNLGKDCINAIKLLLVDKTSVGSLKQGPATPHGAVGALHDVVADRPLLPSSADSLSQLVQVYQTACNAIHGKLVAEFPKVYPNCSAFLSDLFPSDPAAGWITRLDAIKAGLSGSGNVGIQYYYDFLKDLVETYNQFLELLFGETTWCCPETETFPKHLLLGNLVPGTDLSENRTGLYPSPLASRTVEQLSHATFLMKKLDALIQTFTIPPPAGASIRITPSMCEDQPLEERAIPYYYKVSAAHPIHESWNHRLHRRGLDTYNYSYHASAYGAQGGAATPLTSQIGRFSFYRIEGHIGKNVSTARSAIENQSKSNNLAFAVQAVMLGTDKTKVVKKPGMRYTDLHRLHYVLRQDLFHQLDEVAQFSGKFKQEVDSAVEGDLVTDSPDDNDGASVKQIAEGKNAIVTSKTADARTKLNKSYAQYKADRSWKSDVADAMKAGGEFKYQLGKVVKTEFTTPFDTLISNTHVQWLDWLDDIITKKDEKEDEKLLFKTFVSQHPGMEHFGGVVRGGTFVLVYDGNYNVVADFMLPYLCCEITEEEAEEPALPKPGFKPGWIVDNGVKILPSLNKFFTKKLDLFKGELNLDLDKKLNVQKEYIDVFKESANVWGNVYGNLAKGGLGEVSIGLYGDKFLETAVSETQIKKNKVEILKEKAKQQGLTNETRSMYEAQVKLAERELSKSVQETAKYIADSRVDVSTGSEGYKAMLELSKGMGALTDATALTSAKTGLGQIKDATADQSLKFLIGNMM